MKEFKDYVGTGKRLIITNDNGVSIKEVYITSLKGNKAEIREIGFEPFSSRVYFIDISEWEILYVLAAVNLGFPYCPNDDKYGENEVITI